MASTSEASFGAKLANAHKMSDAISTFTNYAHPNSTESVVAFKALLTATEASNSAVASDTDAFNTVVKARELAFRRDDISIIKLMSPIRLAVVAQFGKSSREEKSVMTVISRIRNSKIVNYTDKAGNNQTISQSEQSYGSLTQLFKDLVSVLSNFTAYNPSRNELKTATLSTFANSLEGLSQSVNLARLQLTASRAARLQNYTDLHERSQRIKAYVSSEYGFKSQENAAIKGLSV
jgi:hypothetical protein